MSCVLVWQPPLATEGSPYHRKTFGPADMSKSLRDNGLTPSAVSSVCRHAPAILNKSTSSRSSWHHRLAFACCILRSIIVHFSACAASPPEINAVLLEDLDECFGPAVGHKGESGRDVLAVAGVRLGGARGNGNRGHTAPPSTV